MSRLVQTACLSMTLILSPSHPTFAEVLEPPTAGDFPALPSYSLSEVELATAAADGRLAGIREGCGSDAEQFGVARARALLSSGYDPGQLGVLMGLFEHYREAARNSVMPPDCTAELMHDIDVEMGKRIESWTPN